MTPSLDVPWLQPFPDARLGGPAATVEQRTGLRLALVAALQLLPPRQRAALVLREVLQLSAAEVEIQASRGNERMAATPPLRGRTRPHQEPDEQAG